MKGHAACDLTPLTIKNTVYWGRVVLGLLQLLKLFSDLVCCALLNDHGHSKCSIVILAIDVI